VNAAAPSFSIIIPTHARPDRLRECLTAVAHLDSPGSFEVIVVDDGSPQSIGPVVEAFRDALPIRLVERGRGGPALARNTGASVARGRYLAFVDDDCAPAADWLTVLTAEFERDPRRLLGGRVENALIHNPYSGASEHIGQFVYEYSRNVGAKEPFFTTNNLAVCAEHFRSVGGFTSLIPSETAEDKDFCDRWRARGLPMAHVPHAVVYHAHHLTFSGFLRQHYNYGRGILAFRVLRRDRVSSHGLVPEPASFYVGLLLSPLRMRPTSAPWRLMGLLVCSQLATAAGALVQILRWRQLRRIRASAVSRSET
jgi:glycosyltransferase involved in cell wall biosynthesis